MTMTPREKMAETVIRNLGFNVSYLQVYNHLKEDGHLINVDEFNYLYDKVYPDIKDVPLDEKKMIKLRPTGDSELKEGNRPGPSVDKDQPSKLRAIIQRIGPEITRKQFDEECRKANIPVLATSTFHYHRKIVFPEAGNPKYGPKKKLVKQTEGVQPPASEQTITYVPVPAPAQTFTYQPPPSPVATPPSPSAMNVMRVLFEAARLVGGWKNLTKLAEEAGLIDQQ